MKKSTKVLIIIAVVSLILGTILSVVSLLLMKDAGWKKFKEACEGNGITWNVSEWSGDNGQDPEDVHVKGPFFEVDVQDEDVHVNFFGLIVEVEDGKGRAYMDHDTETSETTVSPETYVSDVSEE